MRETCGMHRLYIDGRRDRDVTHWFLWSENEASRRRSPGAILPALTPPSSWLTNNWAKMRSASED